MHHSSAVLPALDASVVPQLACPACHGELNFDASRLICSGCRRAYPVVDGIPALIVERAQIDR